MGAPMGNKNAAGSRGGSSKGSSWRKSKARARVVKSLKATHKKLKTSALRMSPKTWMAYKASTRKK